MKKILLVAVGFLLLTSYTKALPSSCYFSSGDIHCSIEPLGGEYEMTCVQYNMGHGRGEGGVTIVSRTRLSSAEARELCPFAGM